MSLSDIANVSITSATVGVTAQGFGEPMVLSYNATFPERARSYSDLADMVTDGFATTDPEYLAASALMAQATKVESWTIGKGALPPTQVYKISAKTATAGQEYGLRIGADAISVTAGSGTFASNDEIITDLNAAIQAADGYATNGYTSAVAGGAGVKYITLTANAAGSWIGVCTDDADHLDVCQTHADPGVATDLTAINAYDSTWYGLINPWNSTAMIMAVAAWAESNEKLFVAADCDTRAANLSLAADTALAAAGSAMCRAKTAAYARTAVIYHPDSAEFADAAWLGKCLPYDPGSETWNFKTLAGVDAVSITTTHRTNVLAKYGSVYHTVAGVNTTEGSTVAANEFIDVVRFRDWLKARMQERIFARLVNTKKIPYTDSGIAVIEAEVRGQLDEGVEVGGIATSPEYEVTVPKASACSAADKTARTLRNVKFSCTLAGAIHKLYITGVISV